MFVGLKNWYNNFSNRPSVVLVHGEEQTQQGLRKVLQTESKAAVTIAKQGQKIDLMEQ